MVVRVQTRTLAPPRLTGEDYLSRSALEVGAEHELQLARRSSTDCIGAEGRGDDAEVASGEDASRCSVVRDIEYVEGLCTEADTNPFGYGEALVEASVELPKARSACSVSLEITVNAGRRTGEGGGVEP